MASSPSSAQALQLYRKLLRTVSETFRKDPATVVAARTEIRTHFEKARNEQDQALVARHLAEGEEANDFIKTQVVQGWISPAGDFVADSKHAQLLAEEAAPPKSS